MNYPYAKEILLSVIALIVFYLTKSLLIRNIYKNKDLKKAQKISIQKKINFYSNILLLVLIFLFWFAQLQAIFVSLLAIAAALVLAIKELIMCVTGGILVTINRYFKDGDRIEVDSIRGYVIERSLTVTKVLEIGPEKNSQQTTGNIINVPNSIFLTKSLRNESYFQGYSINSFLFKLGESSNLESLENFLINKANEICSSYVENAKKYISKFCEREGLEIPSIEPRVKIILDEENEISLLLKMPVKNTDVAHTEQKLLRDYITFKGLS